MTEKIETALNRLISVLPLKAKQEACGPELKALHQKMLHSFVEKGRILTRKEMAQHTDQLDRAVETLKGNDMVVFTEGGEPLGAYPFTMEEREHKITINGHSIHAMCALDALSVSPMFAMRTEINSACRVTGHPVCIQQTGRTIENSEETGEVRFGIAWSAAGSCSCCANSLCMEMMFLKDSETAKQWFNEDHANREIFTLPEAVEFGARFFVPLMN